jgi:hypothetical protein
MTSVDAQIDIWAKGASSAHLIRDPGISAPGFSTVMTAMKEARTASEDRSGVRCTFPLRGSVGSEISQRGSGDHVALNVKGIVNGRMPVEAALGRSH